MRERAVTAQDSILLIDDDELVAGSLREYLVRGGSQVDVAVEPSSAEEMMHARQYDVIVVDPYLTGGVFFDNGSAIDLVRRLQPSAAVIVLTAYSSPALARIAADSSVSAVLEKPQPVVALNDLIVRMSREPSARAPG